jgi:hypothetical protein
MGVVVLAKDRRLGREVVIKTAIGSSSLEDELRARAQREAQALAQVRHTNLLEVYAAEIGPQGSYLVMEYVRGRPLSELPPDRDWRTVFRQVAAALAALHEAGLVHRDVKPANILEEEGGRVVLIDLGLVRDERATAITRTGVVVGTIGFMAPEVLQGAAPSPASDWFAWAVSFYWALTRRMPFGSPEMIAHVGQGAPLECDLSVVPEDLREVFRAYLSPTPEERAGPPPRLEGAATRAIERALPGPSGPETEDPARMATTKVLGRPPSPQGPSAPAAEGPAGRVVSRRVAGVLGLGVLGVVAAGAWWSEVPGAETPPVTVSSRALAPEVTPTRTPTPAPTQTPVARAGLASTPAIPQESASETSRPTLGSLENMDLAPLEQVLASRLRAARDDWAAGRTTSAFRAPLEGRLIRRLDRLATDAGNLLGFAPKFGPDHLRLAYLSSVLAVTGYGQPEEGAEFRQRWRRITVPFVVQGEVSRGLLAKVENRIGEAEVWPRMEGPGGSLHFQEFRIPVPAPGSHGVSLQISTSGVEYLRIEGEGLRMLLPPGRRWFLFGPKAARALGSELVVHAGPADGTALFRGWRIRGAETLSSEPAGPALPVSRPELPRTASGDPPAVPPEVRYWNNVDRLKQRLYSRPVMTSVRIGRSEIADPVAAFRSDRDVLCTWLEHPLSRGGGALELLELMAAMDRFDWARPRDEAQRFLPGDCWKRRLRISTAVLPGWPPPRPPDPSFSWEDPEDRDLPLVLSSFPRFLRRPENREAFELSVRAAGTHALEGVEASTWLPKDLEPWARRHEQVKVPDVTLPVEGRRATWLRVRLPYRSNASGGQLQLTFVGYKARRGSTHYLRLRFGNLPGSSGPGQPRAEMVEVRADPSLFEGDKVGLWVEAKKVVGTEARGHRGEAVLEVPWVEFELEAP